MKERALREIASHILEGKVKTKEQLTKLKNDITRRYKLDSFPSNSEILKILPEERREELLNILQKKPVRTISGIAIVAVMTMPYPCPHGKCIYCPGGVEVNVPQSYTGKEPATMRAIEYNFDPYLQTKKRIEQLEEIGHHTDKVEIILMGGTFTTLPIDYQEWFVKRVLNALSDKDTLTLDEAIENAEHCNHRPVGITFETRPDYCKEEQINRLLSYGATRVELGVQNVFDFIYERIKRGHRVKDVVEATEMLKNAALKVGYHIMPGLPGSNPERDIKCAKIIFRDERFKPDMVKIYPALVIKGTELYRMWKNGEYEPYSTEEALEVIVKIKELMPKWVRTLRIQRDVPSNLIEAGVKRSDLGALVYERVKGRCRCIRCREVGHRIYKDGIKIEEKNIDTVVEKYRASGATEFFISVEDLKNDLLIGFIRLRFPEKSIREEIDNSTALVRELHVYGPLVPLGEEPKLFAWQHKGIGKRLLKEAEEIAMSHGKEKMVIISGIGVRDYYRKFGYEREGVYMAKKLSL